MLRDNGSVWSLFSPEVATDFLWDDSFGVKHPARIYVKDWIKEHYKGTKPTLLDIPCGAGVDKAVLDKYVQYTGVDKTSSLIEAIHLRFPDVQAMLGDIRDMKELFADGKFDIVLARAIFEHLCDIEDVEVAMKECFRVAKKHCVFSFFIPLIDSPTEIDWNGKYFNNRYNRKEVEDIVNSFPTKDIEYKHIPVRGTKYIDPYDIFILHK